MRGQDLVRFLNAGQELPSWERHTGMSRWQQLQNAEHMFTVQHVNW